MANNQRHTVNYVERIQFFIFFFGIASVISMCLKNYYGYDETDIKKVVESKFNSDSVSYLKSVKIIDSTFQHLQTGEYTLKVSPSNIYIMILSSETSKKEIIERPMRFVSRLMGKEDIRKILIEKGKTDIYSISFLYKDINPNINGLLSFYRNPDTGGFYSPFAKANYKEE